MELTSVTFLLFTMGVIVASNSFPSVAARSVVLAISSAVFIASFANTPLDLLPLTLFLLTGFVAVRVMQSRPSPLALGVALVVLVASFIYLKRYSFVADLPALPFAYVLVGLSYILFRILHLVVDSYQGMLNEKIGPVTFFNYTCNFLSFVSGPIQRYEDFARAAPMRLVLDDETVWVSFTRIVGGFVKVAVVSAVAKYVFDLLKPRLIEQGAAHSMWAAAILLSVMAAIYLVYLYYNFSGYMDIVIGIGGLIGLQLPENFNKPFSARNFLEFWSRWHMTLSSWFKTYVFNPLLKAMAARVQNIAVQPMLGVVAFFVTFLLMGIWHGSTSVFLVYGLMMGAGASINKLWQIAMPRLVGKQTYKKVCQKGLYQWLSTGMTGAWFAFGLTCFWLDLDQIIALSTALGALGVGLAFLLLSVALGIALWGAAAVARVVMPMFSGIVAYSRGVVARNLVLGTKVVLIVMMVSFLHKAPEFVYRAF